MNDYSELSLPEAWQPAVSHSRFLRQLLAGRPEIVDWLKEYGDAPLSVELMRQFLATEAIHDEDSLKRALRRLRQRVMATLIVRDIGGQAPLDVARAHAHSQSVAVTAHT